MIELLGFNYRQSVAMLQPSILSALPSTPSLSQPARFTTSRGGRRQRGSAAPTLFDQQDHDPNPDADDGTAPDISLPNDDDGREEIEL